MQQKKEIAILSNKVQNGQIFYQSTTMYSLKYQKRRYKVQKVLFSIILGKMELCSWVIQQLIYNNKTLTNLLCSHNSVHLFKLINTLDVELVPDSYIPVLQITQFTRLIQKLHFSKTQLTKLSQQILSAPRTKIWLHSNKSRQASLFNGWFHARWVLKVVRVSGS